MDHLNFKHLRYFWMVGKTGSIVKASEHLNLSPQAISGQLGDLEKFLGIQLLCKVGRGLELTDIGRRVFDFADQIFTLGNQITEITNYQDVKKRTPFRIGITDSVPKLMAYNTIKPLLKDDFNIRIICKEGRLANLLSEMAVNNIDLVIADRPMPNNINVIAYNHLLNESKLSIFATKSLTDAYSTQSFPYNLNNAPFLMPGKDSAFLNKITSWFEQAKIYPEIVGEFDDSALLKSFGQAGVGFFAGPDAISDHICQQYQVEKVGLIDSITEQLYATTTQRRLTHPAVIAIVKGQSNDLI
jgi:LysR family transcriptional regulator, transcriptional activator of nhaA